MQKLNSQEKKYDNFASYYYGTKIGNIKLEEKGKAIG